MNPVWLFNLVRLKRRVEFLMGAYEDLRDDLVEIRKDVGEAIGVLADRIAVLEAELAGGSVITAEQLAELRGLAAEAEDALDAIAPDAVVEPEPEPEPEPEVTE